MPPICFPMYVYNFFDLNLVCWFADLGQFIYNPMQRNHICSIFDNRILKIRQSKNKQEFTDQRSKIFLRKMLCTYNYLVCFYLQRYVSSATMQTEMIY